MKQTIKDKIVDVLKVCNRPLGEHEFPYLGTNASSVSRRLRELQAAGVVIGIKCDDKKYKKWFLKCSQLTLF